MPTRLLLAAALVLALPASAREVTHELGATEVPNAPERIVVLEFSFVDALAAVEVSPLGIADDNDRGRIQPVLIERIGDDWTSVGTRKTPSLEIIASLRPDLIIADLSRHEGIYETLGQIAPTIVYDSLTGDYADVVEQAAEIGAAVGESDRMADFQTGHTKRMKAIRDEVAPILEDRSAQFGVISGNGLWLHTPESYVGSLLEYFGAQPAIGAEGDSSYDELYLPTTLEQLSVVNPDLLILGKSEGESTLDQIWQEEALWQQLSAVKSDNVFDVSSDLWSRSRGMLTAEQTAADLQSVVQSVK